jgi:hypothetical protein
VNSNTSAMRDNSKFFSANQVNCDRRLVASSLLCGAELEDKSLHPGHPEIRSHVVENSQRCQTCRMVLHPDRLKLQLELRVVSTAYRARAAFPTHNLFCLSSNKNCHLCRTAVTTCRGDSAGFQWVELHHHCNQLQPRVSRERPRQMDEIDG